MYPMHPTPLQIACVASVFAQVWRESWDESKEKEWQGTGRREKETAFPLFPSPFPFHFEPNPPVLLGMYCTLESGRRGVGWGLLSGQNKVSCCLDFVGPSLFKINPCCLKLPKGWLISLFLVSRKIFLLRALFSCEHFHTKNVEQIQWHITITLRKKYSPGQKTPLEKDKVYILCTHPFFLW